MTLRSIRLWLGGLLLVALATTTFFYFRQNAGLQVGGAISLPKMAWLSYALTAWFLLPFFLWRDQRIDKSVRKIFGLFWFFMMARGLAEVVLIYAFGHWHPWYGIGHDLAAFLLVAGLRRGVCPSNVVSQKAFRFTGTLLLGLIAETCFAGMFLQTGVHESATYFASSSPQWNFVNTTTILVLAFVLPDFVTTLLGLWFPGSSRETSKLLSWSRSAAAIGLSIITIAALGLWSYMMDLEKRGAHFQETGSQIINSLKQFAKDFRRNDAERMNDFILGGQAGWVLAKEDHDHKIEVLRWTARETGQELNDFFLEIRKNRPTVLEVVFKLHLLDEIISEREARATFRFEITTANQTDYGLIQSLFQQGNDGRWRIASGKLVKGWTVSGPANHFVDEARTRGIDFVLEVDPRFDGDRTCTDHDCPGPHKLAFETMRHAYAGAATADFDNDGYDDVFLCNGRQPVLYRNRGDGTFEPRTGVAGLDHLWHINVACFSDIDNDGDQDLFVGAFFGPNHLLLNNGDGTFEDISARSGIQNHDYVTSLSFFDYDTDGDLDLYLGRFVNAETSFPDSFLYTRNGEPNVLYRNNGDHTFTDVTKESGLGDIGLTLAMGAADYDEDGDQDVYVANDFGRNALYQNQGDGTFRDVAKETGALGIGGSMSTSWGDYDNDGRVDLYVGAVRSNQRWFVQPITAKRVVWKFIREGKVGNDNPILTDLQSYMGDDWSNIGNIAMAGNALFRQNEDHTFTNVSKDTETRPAGWYWSSGFLDIDNDGDLDIYATDGWITGKDTHDL